MKVLAVAFTAGDVIALVAVVSGLLGIAVTARSASYVARSRFEHERGMALAERRASAYLTIAEFVVRLRAAVAAASPERTDDFDSVINSIDDDKWWLIQANARVYGTPEVVALFEALQTKRARFRGALGDWSEALRLGREIVGDDSLRRLEDFRGARAEALAGCASLLDRLNEEVGSATSDASPSSRWRRIFAFLGLG